MIDHFYILSKDCGDGPYYIGDLRRLSKGHYKFNYAFTSEKFPKYFMYIPGFEDINSEYYDEDVVKYLLERVVLEPTHMFIRSFMDNYGMTDISVDDYDPWDTLVLMCDDWKRTHPVGDIFPLRDGNQTVYFYESLPKGVNRFDETLRK